MKGQVNPATKHLSAFAASFARRTLLIFGSFALAASAAYAADFGDRTPSVNELINALSVRPSADIQSSVNARPDGVRTRGIKIVSPDSQPANSDASEGPGSGGGKVSMSIQFELNSDRVLRPSADSLSNLAAALNSEALKNKKFEVIGHTDITGSANYNFRLSERRARSVAEFLGTVGVELSRARTLGRGPHEPLEGIAPNAPQQRRVEIRMMQ